MIHYRLYHRNTCDSDHYLPIAKLNEKQNQERPQRQHQTTKARQPRFNLENLDYGSTKELYRRRLDQKLHLQQFNNNTEHYECIKQCIKEALEEAWVYSHHRKSYTPYWYDEDIPTSPPNKPGRVRRKNVACHKIYAYLGGTKITESWKLLNSLRQNNKNQSPITTTKWNEYFGKLLKEVSVK